MRKEEEVVEVHPEGELQISGNEPPESGASLDTFAGKVNVRWVPEAAVSGLGLMVFFIEFLKTSGLFDKFVEDCPLSYTSANAPEKRDVLGTLLLSVLAGHWRYAHINAIRADGVNPELLGMTKVASEDSVRRAMKAMDEGDSGRWLKKHLKASYEPLLQEPWILDVDSTVKPLYGHQQDAKAGYNPTKPGRPSHVYHSYLVANMRMLLDMEIQAGNQTAPSYAQPELWAFLDGLSDRDRPVFLRGDSHWGTECRCDQVAASPPTSRHRLRARVNLLQAPHADGVALPRRHGLGGRACAAHSGDAGHPMRHRAAPDGLLVEECRRASGGVDRQLNGPCLQQVHRVGAAFIHLEHDLARQPRRAQHRSEERRVGKECRS